MSKMITILCTAVALITCSCYRIDCPGYADKYLCWIPYAKGDSIRFTDGTDTLKLKVNDASRSDAYTSESWIIKQTCFIHANASATSEFDTASIYANSLYETENKGLVIYEYQLSFKTASDYFSFYLSGNGLSGNYSATLEKIPVFNNGFKDYSDVLKMEKDTTYSWGKPLIYKLYIAKSVGIVQFTEYRNKRTWSLLE